MQPMPEMHLFGSQIRFYEPVTVMSNDNRYIPTGAWIVKFWCGCLSIGDLFKGTCYSHRRAGRGGEG